MKRLEVGKITAAHAVKGEVSVYPYTDDPSRFEELEGVYVSENDYKKIEKVHYSKNLVLLKLEGVDDRNAAEQLRNAVLSVEREKLWELPEDEYLIEDLKGLAVFDEDGNRVGILNEVVANPANDLYEVRPDDGTKNFLVPAKKNFIKEVDVKAGKMVIHLIEGLRDL